MGSEERQEPPVEPVVGARNNAEDSSRPADHQQAATGIGANHPPGSSQVGQVVGSRSSDDETSEGSAAPNSPGTPPPLPRLAVGQLVSPIAFGVFYVGLGLWLWCFTDEWLLGGVLVGLLSAVLGYVSKLFTKEEHEAFQAWGRRQLLDSVRLRWLSVSLCLGAVVVGSFLGGFQFESSPAVNEYRLGAPGAEGVKIPNPEEHTRVLRWIPWSFFTPRPFEVTADGHPVRRLSLRPWQRKEIDSKYLWKEPVLLLLPSRKVIERTRNNPARLTLSMEGREDIELSGYRGQALWVGPIRQGRVPQEVLAAWRDAGYSPPLIEEVWRKPITREKLQAPLPAGAKVSVSMHWERTGSEMGTVLSSPEKGIGEGRLPDNYPQWKVIDVP